LLVSLEEEQQYVK